MKAEGKKKFWRHIPGLLFAPEPRFLRFFSSSFPMPFSGIRLLVRADGSFLGSSASILLFFDASKG
jgi:hypothetical protein